MEQFPVKLLPHWLKPKKSNNLYLCSNHRNSLNLYRRKIYSKQNCTTNNTFCVNVTFKVLRDRRREQVHIWLCILNNLMVLYIVLSRHQVGTRDTRPTRIVFKGAKLTITNCIHHHLALQPYVSLGLLCYSPPLVSLLSFPSSSFNPHLS